MKQLRFLSLLRLLLPMLVALVLQLSFGPAVGQAEAKKIPVVPAPIEATIEGFTWGG